MTPIEPRSGSNAFIWGVKRDLISEVMREMREKGGKAGRQKGGKARMASLTPEQRKELAKKAIQTRWAKARKKPRPSAK